MTVTLTFSGGKWDGRQNAYADDELPTQEAFTDDGYWIEDVIVNDRMMAVPLTSATPNDWPFA